MAVAGESMTKNDGGAIRQTIFYPYLHASLFGRGTALQTIVDCGKYDCPEYSDVPYIDSIAVETENGVTVFAVNRSNEEVILECKAENFTCANNPSHTAMYEENILAANTFENPDCVKPKKVSEIVNEDNIIKTKLNPASWNVIQF